MCSDDSSNGSTGSGRPSDNETAGTEDGEDDPEPELAFSLAALVFGFGLTVWAGTLLLGESLAGMHAMLDRDWSAADTRRAMAILTVVGAAGMVSASVTTILLGG
ncbi:DUF7268 family protein [Halalkalicoccus paucihalophilus]|uniref:DUF7268 family protein n=1 Tax=Halalkalicoccus paucihalophilus TaxID=1008153 RepID=UPI001FDFFA0F|nr:hypothetical protein [Halalkalicoccus paucihalophilus]